MHSVTSTRGAHLQYLAEIEAPEIADKVTYSHLRLPYESRSVPEVPSVNAVT